MTEDCHNRTAPEKIFSYSEFENRYATDPVCMNTTWKQFCEDFSHPDRNRGTLDSSQYHRLDPADSKEKDRRSSEKDGPAWSPALYAKGGRRGNADVERLSAFVGDLDSGDMEIAAVEGRLSGLEFLIHTTYSHRPDRPKLRVIIPFEQPYPASEIYRVFDHFNELLDERLDACSKKPAQMYYKPSCPSGGEYLVFRGRGKKLLLGKMKFHRELRTRRGDAFGFGRADGGMPPRCADGARHEQALPWIGRLLANGYDREEVVYCLRKWNASNVDKWPEEKLLSLIDGMIKTDQRNHPERHVDAPWNGCDVPAGFCLTNHGVFSSTDGTREGKLVAGPVWVSARTRGPDGMDWGLLVEWLDNDQTHQRVAVPAQRLHELGGTLVPELAAAGLYVVPGLERSLIQYLGRYQPEKRLTSVARLGWLDAMGAEMAYMLPAGVQDQDGAGAFVFQPERYSPTTSTIRTQASLKDWQDHVVAKVRGNPFLIFGACVGFAGPLLKPARMESGGFHIFGASSRGKTTIGQVAASVMGCGADPAESPGRSYIQRWNTTLNGLEGLAAAHNDGLLVLDELQTCAARDLRTVIYNLSGGHGKVAMNASRTLRPPREWRLIFLSTGEISIEQKIEEEKHQVSPGQRLRMLDIPIGEGIIENPHGQSEERFVTGLKQDCADYFGTAGLEFIGALIRKFETFVEFQLSVKQGLETAMMELPSHALEPEAKRAQKRFALVQVAGEIAVDFGVLPITIAEVVNAVRVARDAWIDGLGHLSEAIRGMEALVEFLQRYHGRFQDAIHDDRTGFPQESFGFIDLKERVYLLHQGAFQQAIKRSNQREVCRELQRRGYLAVNEPDRLMYKKHIPQLAARVRFYAVRFALLEADLNEWRDTRDYGTTDLKTGT